MKALNKKRITKEDIQKELDKLQDLLNWPYPLRMQRTFLGGKEVWINSVFPDGRMGHFCGFYEEPLTKREIIIAIGFAQAMVKKAYNYLWEKAMDRVSPEYRMFLIDNNIRR